MFGKINFAVFVLGFEPDDVKLSFEEFRMRPRTNDVKSWANELPSVVSDVSDDDNELKSVKF